MEIVPTDVCNFACAAALSLWEHGRLQKLISREKQVELDCCYTFGWSKELQFHSRKYREAWILQGGNDVCEIYTRSLLLDRQIEPCPNICSHFRLTLYQFYFLWLYWGEVNWKPSMVSLAVSHACVCDFGNKQFWWLPEMGTVSLVTSLCMVLWLFSSIPV